MEGLCSIKAQFGREWSKETHFAVLFRLIQTIHQKTENNTMHSIGTNKVIGILFSNVCRYVQSEAPMHKVNMIAMPTNKTASIYYFNECFLMQTNRHRRPSSLIVFTKIWCNILLYMHLCSCHSNSKNNNIIQHVNKFIMRNSHSEKLFQFIAQFVLERRMTGGWWM